MGPLESTQGAITIMSWLHIRYELSPEVNQIYTGMRLRLFECFIYLFL